MVRTIIAIAIAIVASTGYAQPTAGDSEARAKQSYERGKAFVSETRFADAYSAFAAGYEASPRPLFLFNMGECSRALGDKTRARDLYQRYLADDPSGELVATARARLAELGPALAEPPRAPAKPTVTIPPPLVAAEVASPMMTPPNHAITVEQPSPPLWRRKSLWIAVGVAIIGGSVAVYAATRHGETCTPPSCVPVH